MLIRNFLKVGGKRERRMISEMMYNIYLTFY